MIYIHEASLLVLRYEKEGEDVRWYNEINERGDSDEKGAQKKKQ
jgi:hypothetical protein